MGNLRLGQVLLGACVCYFLLSSLGADAAESVCDKPSVGSFFEQKGYYSSAQAELLMQTLPTSTDGIQHENYDLIMNLDFKAPDYRGSEKDQMEQQFRDYTANCLQELSQFMIGPLGEHVTVRFPQTDDEYASTPTAKITVKRDCGLRSNSNCWNSTISCATIWHETFHRLGLFDEYVENYGAYNCRAIGPKESVMNNPVLALQSLYPSYLVSIYMCPENNSGGDPEQCAQILDEVAKGGAPRAPVVMKRRELAVSGIVQKPIGSGDPLVEANYENSILNPNLRALEYYGITGLKDLGPKEILNYGNARTGGLRVSPLRYEVATVILPERKTAVAPAEFTAIVFPGCSINNLFYTCGKFVTSSGSCSNRPVECDNANLWTALPDGQIP